MSNAVKVVMTKEQEDLAKEVAALKEKVKALRAQQTKGMSLKLGEYIDGKTGEVRRYISIRGLGMKPHNFFPQQIERLVANTPEAEANRQAVLEFIEANRSVLSFKK